MENTESPIGLSINDFIHARNIVKDNEEVRNALTEFIIQLIIYEIGIEYSKQEEVVTFITESTPEEVFVGMDLKLEEILSALQPKFNYPMPWVSISQVMASIFAVAKREGVGYKDLFEHPYRVITNYQPETNGISIHFIIPNRDPPSSTPPYASVKMELEELTKGDVCAICLEKAENKGVKCKTCGGEFHEGCVRKQLQEGCSLCRGILL